MVVFVLEAGKRMDKKRLNVFISSTSIDLPKLREAVRDESPVDYCEQMVDKAISVFTPIAMAGSQMALMARASPNWSTTGQIGLISTSEKSLLAGK
jgi:hypothetical protein